MSKYIIREPLDAEILKSIKVLYSSFGRALPEDIKEEEKIWKALIDWKIGKFLICEEKGKILGIGGVFLFEKVSSFGYMAVLPEYRGRGLGTKIFSRLLDIANTMNCETKILYASKLGEPIYRKYGFQGSFYGTMYSLPKNTIEFDIINNEIRTLNVIPDWLFSLDKQAMGFNRSKYLNLKVTLGAKVITIDNMGYGLLVNTRLGPLIAKNLEVAIKIVKKGIELGADHMIIAEHQNLPDKFLKAIELNKLERENSIKMVYGNKPLENLNLLYAIGTYAKG